MVNEYQAHSKFSEKPKVLLCAFFKKKHNCTLKQNEEKFKKLQWDEQMEDGKLVG